MKTTKIIFTNFALYLLASFLFTIHSFSQEKFVYKLEKGKNYKYGLNRESKVSVSQMGQEQNFTRKITSIVKFNVVDVLSNGNQIIIFCLDSLSIQTDSPQAPDVSNDISNIIGKKSKCTLLPTGEIKDIEKIDKYELSDIGKRIVGQFEGKNLLDNFFFKATDKPISIGYTWKKSRLDTADQGGLKIFTQTETEYKFDGKEKIEDEELYKISGTTNQTFSGSGNQGGNDLNLTGTGKGVLVIHFSKVKNLMIEFNSEGTQEYYIDVTSQGITVTQTINNTSTVKLLK